MLGLDLGRHLAAIAARGPALRWAVPVAVSLPVALMRPAMRRRLALRWSASCLARPRPGACLRPASFAVPARPSFARPTVFRAYLLSFSFCRRSRSRSRISRFLTLLRFSRVPAGPFSPAPGVSFRVRWQCRLRGCRAALRRVAAGAGVRATGGGGGGGGFHRARRGLLRYGGPQFGLYGGLVGAALPVHAPGQRADQHRMGQHGQRDAGAQARGRAAGQTGRGRRGLAWASEWAARVRFNRLV